MTAKEALLNQLRIRPMSRGEVIVKAFDGSCSHIALNKALDELTGWGTVKREEKYYIRELPNGELHGDD